MAVDRDLGFAGDLVYNKWKCQPSKPCWRGVLPTSEPVLVQNWTVWFNCICSATELRVQKMGFATISIGCWCWLEPC